MPLSSVEPRRLYRQIADQLRASIQRGEFLPGSRLPPERDLARQLGVSRPSVREALIALEVEGLVDVRIGSGIYVRAQGGPAAHGAAAAGSNGQRAPPRGSPGANGHAHGAQGGGQGDAAAGPFELLRARHLIESECAALAAKHAKRAQVDAIAAALDEMQAEMDAGAMPLAADRLFHLRIAEATGNGALVYVVRLVWEERTGPLYQQLEHHYDSPRLWNTAMAEHRRVIDAIAVHDPAAARAAMQRHLDQAYKRFSKGWNARN